LSATGLRKKGDDASATSDVAPAEPRFSLAAGQVVLVKIGGQHLESEEGIARVAAGVKLVQAAGSHVVIVHGGGKGIDAAMKEANLEIKKVAGLRITSPQALEVIEFVLRTINRRLVRALRKAGVGAVGMDAADVVKAMKYPPVLSADGPVSLGHVGEVVGFDFEGCESLRKEMFDGVVPVVYCIGESGGARVNINADSIAGALAGGLRAGAAIFVSDVPGILDASGSPLASVDPRDLAQLEAEGVIQGGMRPKVDACVEAIDRGVAHVVVASGIQEAAAGGGTLLRKSAARASLANGPPGPAGPSVKIIQR
jgi:acetylglutamate kinase